MYKKLKQFVTRAPMIEKISQYIAGKVIHSTANKLKVPLKDAMCILVLDDFIDDAKQFGQKAWSTLKDFVY